MKTLLVSISLSLLTVFSFGQQTTNAKPSSSAPAAAANVTPPAHPITPDQMRDIFELGGTRHMMEQTLHHFLETQKKAWPPFIPAGFWTDFEQSFAKVDFVRLMLPVYQKYLSEEDAEKTIAFYRTPAGKRFIEVMPLILMECGDIGNKEGQRIATEVLERHKQEILAAEKKYEEQRGHTDDSDKAPPAIQRPDAAEPKTPQ